MNSDDDYGSRQLGVLKPVVLASASRARRAMLAAAGVKAQAVPSGIDEAAMQAALCAKAGGIEPQTLAKALARAKSEDVSARAENRSALVIGGDQVLAAGGELLFKAATVDGVREKLLRLRGRTHELVSAATLAMAGKVVWAHVDVARITLRSFSMATLDRYLADAGEHIIGSVGGYQIEGLGIQLMERVEGDHFTILGLPLVPLLGELRLRGALLE